MSHCTDDATSTIQDLLAGLSVNHMQSTTCLCVDSAYQNMSTSAREGPGLRMCAPFAVLHDHRVARRIMAASEWKEVVVVAGGLSIV